MLTVIETPEFIVWADKVWSDDERKAFIDWISVNADAGDVIPGAGGLRKVRWCRQGMGKRGGARVIYFTRNTSRAMSEVKWCCCWCMPRPSSTTSVPMC